MSKTILPLACPECGRRIDCRGDEPMPNCPDCRRRMRPAGAVRTEGEKTAANDMPVDFIGSE